MLRRVIAGSSVGLLLAAGLVGSSAGAAYEPWGSTHAKDQVLKPSCAHYPYRYRIDPPDRRLGGRDLPDRAQGRADRERGARRRLRPARSARRWRLCRPSITPGRYKIRMKITYLDGYDKYEGFVKPSYFRLDVDGSQRHTAAECALGAAEQVAFCILDESSSRTWEDAHATDADGCPLWRSCWHCP